jgi:N-acetylglucosaminyldiphosphoundecaprenol N-acetyl-beta-D-mannosaminyltransferase
LNPSIALYAKSLFLTWFWLELSTFISQRWTLPAPLERLHKQGTLDCLCLYLILYYFLVGSGIETYLHLIFPVFLIADYLITSERVRLQLFFWLEVVVLVALVFYGLKISFVSNPSGGMFFLGKSAFYVSFFWLIFIVSLINLFNMVEGLLCGIGAVLSYAFLFTIFIQPSIDPNAVRLAMILGAFCTLQWFFITLREKRGSQAAILSSTLSILVGALSIISTSKGIALLSVGMILGLFAIPVVVFAFIIFFTHLQYKFRAGSLADKHHLLWRFSTSSVNAFVVLASFTMVFILFVGLKFPDKFWSFGLSLFAVIMFARLARQIFIKRVIRYKDIFFPHEDHIMLFQTRIFRGTKDRAMEIVAKILSSDDCTPQHVVTPDALCLYRTTWEPEFAEILHRAHMAIPDGAGVLWASIFLKERPILERIPGIEFSMSLCELCQKEGYPVYFLGAREEALQTSLDVILKKFPQLKIAGSHDGYFEEEHEEALVNEINESGARLLFIALGVPRQEYWIERNRDKLKVQLMMGIGGSLDVISGNIPRCPKFFQDYGLEWFYRTLREPWRISRIYSLPLYILHVVREKLEDGDKEHERSLAP